MKSFKLLVLAGAITAGSFMISCGDDDSTSAVSSNSVKENYANMITANYADVLAGAKTLETAINDFVANPTTTSHANAKKAWLDSRESYGLTEVYRFWAGPIDDSNGVEGALNAWPLNENFIDYVYNPTTHEITNEGLIGDVTFDLTLSNIVDQNESVDEKSISIGYHAIEFLLWGQDFNLNPTTGAVDYEVSGMRPVEDFTTNEFAERRKTYLKLITEQLITDLTYLNTAWKDNNAWGKKAFLAQTDEEALKDMFNGMGKLAKGELAGERMHVAVLNKDQEDEHSCFSDNTHRDIVQNFMGIKNVWEGKYSSIQGGSIKDLIEQADAALALKINTAFSATETLVLDIDKNKPFDELISGTDADKTLIITNAVASLQELGDLLVEGASKLGISFTADLDE